MEKIQEVPNFERLQELASHLRRLSFEIIKGAGSGHLGACSSSAELLTSLYFGGVLRFDPDNPDHPNRDKILLRGHLGPLRYSIFNLIGLLEDEEMSGYRQINTRLKGHECMHSTPGVDITPSGSLGMVLSYGVGAAITAQHQGLDSIQYVFLGDGEEQEGNVSEAARHAATMRLDNLVCIIDKNGKQLSRPTSDNDGATDLAQMWKSYGWDVIEIDGHDIESILQAFDHTSEQLGKPKLIIAHTQKGKGLSGNEDHFSGFHTISTCSGEILDSAIATIQPGGTLSSPKDLITRPSDLQPKVVRDLAIDIPVNPQNRSNLDRSQVEYFARLREILESAPGSPEFYLLTADFVRADVIKALALDDFMTLIDVGLREQHMIAMAHGISVTDPHARVIVNYGDAFIYRAMDQINASAQGGSSMTILSEYAGLSQGQNGATHQSIGQPACMATAPGINFYEPADVTDIFTVLNKSLTYNTGIDYIRIHREDVTELPRTESDPDWRAYEIRREESPDVVVVTSGLLAGHTLEASNVLAQQDSVRCRVVNVVDLSAVDAQFAQKYLENDIPVVTTYNGTPQLLGSALAQAVLSSQHSPRPNKMVNHGFTKGDTGKVNDLLKAMKLDAAGVREIILQTINEPKVS